MALVSNLLGIQRSDDTLSFAAIFVAGFVALLALALLGAVLRLNWRFWLPLSGKRDSLLESLKATVFGFMASIP
jgi:hypothetical protein